MWTLSKKANKSTKSPIVDYREYPFDILLYKSAEHYRTWVVFNENIPLDQREEFKENPRLNLSPSIYSRAVNLTPKTYFLKKEFLVEPLIISSRDFSESDLSLAKKDYTLFESEKEFDQCPFCRINPKVRQMRILAGDSKQGTIEGGGVVIPCIHLLFDEDYEPLTFGELAHRGFRLSGGLRKIWGLKKERF